MGDNHHLVQGDRHSDSALINHSNVWNLRPEITSPHHYELSHHCLDVLRGSPHRTETPVPNLHSRGGQLGRGGSDKSRNDNGVYGISRDARLKISAKLEGEEQYQTHPSHQQSETYTVKRRGYICPILKKGCPYMLRNGGFRNFAEIKYSFNSCP